MKDVDVGQKCKLVSDFSLLEGQNAATANTNSLYGKYMTYLILSSVLLAHSLMLMLPPIFHYVGHHQFQLQADDRIINIVVYILCTQFLANIIMFYRSMLHVPDCFFIILFNDV